jgi:DNA-binding NarL/FixJ family response regulator
MMEHHVIQIGIVDPHEIMRKGLVHLIELAGGMRVIGDASNVADLVALVENAHVDILIVEPLSAWGLNIAMIQSLRSKHEHLKVLVFSESTDKEHLQSALRAGVLGYVSKRAKLHELIRGIQNLAQGEPFLCAEVTAKLTLCIVNTFSKQPHELLSSRELQILLLLVNGKSIAEIADELSLSAKTISTHKTRLMEKMSLDSFSRLVQYASAHGLITDAGEQGG